MAKYILKRVLLLLLTLFIILTISFVLVKMLDVNIEGMSGPQVENIKAKREALGYNDPIMVQYFRYWKNIATEWNWGLSWYIDYLSPVADVVAVRLPPTMLINIYSLLFSIPFGIGLGIIAALFKNKLIDHIISVGIMFFISVPMFIVAFLLQYLMYYKWGLLPAIVSSLENAGGSWFSPVMFKSMLLPIMAMSFGTVAGLARFTRAELTEVMTSEYLLLARTKGLTRSQAISRHAMRNAMVPILPMIIAEFASIMGGSIIIESIFAVPGVGKLFLESIGKLDYDVYMYVSAFYTSIGLAASILIDLSYGFVDPRIRMGAK